jgi:DNA-binding Lrp family transcriptional regulator
MSKKTKKSLKLDLIDKKLLYELDTNARQTYSQLAKKLSVSKDVVIYRIRNLEKKGVIEGYYTVIDFSKLGYYMIRAYLKFQDVSLVKEQEIIDYLKKQKEVFVLYQVEAEWDIAMGIMVKNLKDFDTFWRNFQLKYRRYTDDKSITPFFEYLHFRRSYLIDKHEIDYEPQVIGEPKEVRLDETDIKLLTIMSTKARISLLELARSLGLTPMSIKYRINQLIKKKTILGYRAMINLAAIGYQYYKADIELEDLNVRKQLYMFAKQHPNITYEDRSIGGSDFEFDLEVRNHDEFLLIMNGIRKKFGEAIRNYKYYVRLKNWKTLYMPI